jgi:hypothetical protein
MSAYTLASSQPLSAITLTTRRGGANADMHD